MCEKPAVAYKHLTPVFPDPIEVLHSMYGNFTEQARHSWESGSLGESLNQGFVDLSKYFFFGKGEIVHIVAIALTLTVLRIVVEKTLLKRIAEQFKLEEETGKKFPESVFSFCIYLVSWCCSLTVVIGNKGTLYSDLGSHWSYWSIGVQVETEIYWLYMFEIGFYIHFVITTIFINIKRKDYCAMLTHHVLTMTLLIWSYGIRYHYIGVLILFFYDIGDVLLEFSKICVYFKKTNGHINKMADLMANIIFMIFVLSWVVFRLYLFPSKAMYSTVVASRQFCASAGAFYMPLNLMLFALYLLQVYWFYFIVNVLVKFAIYGEVEDNREFDILEKQKLAKTIQETQKKLI